MKRNDSHQIQPLQIGIIGVWIRMDPYLRPWVVTTDVVSWPHPTVPHGQGTIKKTPYSPIWAPKSGGSNQWVKKQTSKQAQQTQEIPVKGWKTNTKKHTPNRTILSSSFVFDQKTVPLVFVCSRRVQHISSSHPRAPNISPVVGREMIYTVMALYQL